MKWSKRCFVYAIHLVACEILCWYFSEQCKIKPPSDRQTVPYLAASQHGLYCHVQSSIEPSTVPLWRVRSGATKPQPGTKMQPGTQPQDWATFHTTLYFVQSTWNAWKPRCRLFFLKVNVQLRIFCGIGILDWLNDWWRGFLHGKETVCGGVSGMLGGHPTGLETI